MRGPLRWAERPSQTLTAQNRGEAPSSSSAEPVIGPATSGRTRWLLDFSPHAGKSESASFLILAMPCIRVVSRQSTPNPSQARLCLLEKKEAERREARPLETAIPQTRLRKTAQTICDAA